MQNVHFTPPYLAQYLGVNPSTIKRWVDKGFLKAEVTPGGHRRIHKRELARFLKQHPRYAPHSYIARHIDATVSSDDAERYYGLLYRKEYVKARNELSRLLFAGARLEDVIEEIIRPVLVMVGQNWIDKKIDIADEHRISFIIRSHLDHIDTLIPEPSGDAPVALLACPRGEHHEIPLVIVSLLLKKYGVRSEMLGINVPTADLVGEITKTYPNFVGLSKHLSTNELDTRFYRDVGSVTKRVGATLLLGGSGWQMNDFKKLERHAKKIAFVTSAKVLKEAVMG